MTDVTNVNLITEPDKSKTIKCEGNKEQANATYSISTPKTVENPYH